MTRLVTLFGVVALTLGMQQVLANPGDVTLQSASNQYGAGESFTVNARVDSGTSKVGAFNFRTTYFNSKFTIDTTVGTQGVSVGPDGFLNQSTTDNLAGSNRSIGEVPEGTGPGTDLDFLVYNFVCDADAAGDQATIRLRVDELTDELDQTIGTPAGSELAITCGAAGPVQYSLTVTNGGNGTLTSAPAGIDCGADCSEDYSEGTTVTLSASPDTGYTFDGWTGDCDASGEVVMSEPRACGATFSAVPSYTLTVTNGGNGTVTSAPAGIDCGADCSEDYSEGTTVTLSASPDTGYTFDGWTGDCDASGEVVMSGPRNCGASFSESPTVSLTVALAGEGAGSVISEPPGIDCGVDCTADYEPATIVALTPTPDEGSVFAGWSGAGCSGTARCLLTMDGEKSVTATFDLAPGDPCSLDVDDNGFADALTDGILTVRYEFGFRGTTLTDGAVGSGCTRCDAAAIEAFLVQCRGAGELDVDGNSTTDALTDGILTVRYEFGFRGTTLTDGAVGVGCTRCDATAIENYLGSRMP